MGQTTIGFIWNMHHDCGIPAGSLSVHSSLVDNNLLRLKRKTQRQCFQGSKIRLSVHFVVGCCLPVFYLTTLWHAMLMALPCLSVSKSEYQPNEMRVHPESWIGREEIVTYLIYLLKLPWQKARACSSASLGEGPMLQCSGGCSLASAQLLKVIAVKSGDVSGRGVGASPFSNSAVKPQLFLIKELPAWLSWCRPEQSGVQPALINAAETLPAGFDAKRSDSCGCDGFRGIWLLRKSTLCHIIMCIWSGWKVLFLAGHKSYEPSHILMGLGVEKRNQNN